MIKRSNRGIESDRNAKAMLVTRRLKVYLTSLNILNFFCFVQEKDKDL